jgi:glycosyltransferase involved in cell wall biosynthesis
MKLLLLVSEGGDAQRRAVHAFVSAARRRADDVRVLAPDSEGKLLRDLGVPIESWQPSGLFNVLGSIGVLRRAVEHHTPGVIHAVGWEAAAVVLGALPAGFAARTVVTLLDPIHEGEIPKPFVDQRLPELLRRAADVVCAYPTLAGELVARFGVAAERITVIPYGVTPSVPADIERPAERAGPIVGYAGGPEGGRAWGIAFDAVAAVERTFPAARLHFAIPPSAASLLRAYARGRNVRYDVVPLEDLGSRAFVGAIDLLVVPHGWDGLPWGLLQAVVDGVPVVAADRDGSADTLRALGTGLLVRDDAPAFAEGIAQTWGRIDRAWREAQGRRPAATGAFDPAQVDARITTIYDRIAAAAINATPHRNDE